MNLNPKILREQIEKLEKTIEMYDDAFEYEKSGQLVPAHVVLTAIYRSLEE